MKQKSENIFSLKPKETRVSEIGSYFDKDEAKKICKAATARRRRRMCAEESRYEDLEEVEDLMTVEEGLSDWEMDFLDSVKQRFGVEGYLTSKQKFKINELWDKHFRKYSDVERNYAH